MRAICQAFWEWKTLNSYLCTKGIIPGRRKWPEGLRPEGYISPDGHVKISPQSLVDFTFQDTDRKSPRLFQRWACLARFTCRRNSRRTSLNHIRHSLSTTRYPTSIYRLIQPCYTINYTFGSHSEHEKITHSQKTESKTNSFVSGYCVTATNLYRYVTFSIFRKNWVIKLQNRYKTNTTLFSMSWPCCGVSVTFA